MLRMFALLLWMGLCAVSALSQNRTVSHVTSSFGGFTTTVLIENSSVEFQPVTLKPYDIGGNPLPDAELMLAPGAVISRASSELFEGEVSHFDIEAADAVVIGVNYDFQLGQGSPAFVAETSEQASGWRIFPGNWDHIFDGIAVVNTGDVPTDVWIAQKDTNNNVIGAQKVASGLGPNAKALYVVGSPDGSAFTNEGDTYFEVTGDQLLAITALRGTLPDADVGLLWGNQSRGLSHSHSKRDEFGVWFIEDGSLYDIFEMVGYNIAVDRLFQIEIGRRLARGRMAEIDAGFLDFDILVRQLMYSDTKLDSIFAGLDSESRTMIQAYVDGTNRRIGQVNATAGTENSIVPLEFTAVSITQVEPWTVRDVMAHMARIQRGFSMRTAGSEQVLNGALLMDLQAQYGAEQGAEMFDDLRYTYDPETITMIPKRDTEKTRTTRHYLPSPIVKKEALGLSGWFRGVADRLQAFEDLQREMGILVKMGSYAWAVSGSHTASGNPILYSGPQVGFSAPGVTVEGSVVSDALTVSGMLIPGVPAFAVGRTPHHAWSLQVGHANSWDYYVVDESEAFVDRTETIKVRGGSDVVIDVEHSPHGPIIDALDERRLAFKYAHRDVEFNLGGGILAMNRATSMEEFGNGVVNLGISQHITYVDVDGNIAYWHSGRTPVRPEGDYRVPQGILEGQPVLEWDQDVFHPPAHDSNPPEGWYGGWNNKARYDDVDVVATSSHGPFHRGQVIHDWFNQYDPENPWTYEELRDLAIDIGATGNFGAGGNPWPFLEDAVRAAVAGSPTEEREAAMALFDDWDGHSVAGGPSQWVHGQDRQDASVLVDALIPKLLEGTFNDEYGSPIRDYDFFFRFHTMLHGFYPERGLANSYDWFSNLADAEAPQTADAVILMALDETLAELGPRPWGVGARGTIIYANFLFGNIAALPGISLAPTAASNRAAYAQCVEYGSEGPVRIESFFQLGQSGTVLGTLFQPQFDPHVFSMNDRFADFELRPFPLFQ